MSVCLRVRPLKYVEECARVVWSPGRGAGQAEEEEEEGLPTYLLPAYVHTCMHTLEDGIVLDLVWVSISPRANSMGA